MNKSPASITAVSIAALAYVLIALSAPKAAADELFRNWDNQTQEFRGTGDFGKDLGCTAMRVNGPFAPRSLIGVCTSGRNRDCQGSTSHRVKCGYYKINGIYSSNISNTELSGDFGKRVTCPDGQAGGAICASGMNKDCAGASHKLFCGIIYNPGGTPTDPKVRYNFRVASNESQWISRRDWGSYAICPPGMVVTGFCASGSNRDCNGNSHEIRCSKVYARKAR